MSGGIHCTDAYMFHALSHMSAFLCMIVHQHVIRYNFKLNTVPDNGNYVVLDSSLFMDKTSCHKIIIIMIY